MRCTLILPGLTSGLVAVPAVESGARWSSSNRLYSLDADVVFCHSPSEAAHENAHKATDNFLSR
jgi:hypothetical protein